MSTARRILKNTGILYVKVSISAICALISTRFILHALGVEDFGIYNIVGSVIIMLSFLNESMAAATQRFMSYSEGAGNANRSKEVFNVSFILHILIAAIIALLLLLLKYFIFESVLTIASNRVNAAKWVYNFMIISTCLSMTTVPYSAVLIAHEDMKYYSIVGSASAVVKLLISFYLLYYSDDRLILYGILIACVSLIEFMIFRIYCHLHYVECEIDYKKYFNQALFKEMGHFAGWQLFYSSSSILSIQGTSVLLNSFFGTVINAAQGVARQLTGQLMVISNTLLNALNPVIVKSAGAGENENMIKTTLVGSKLSYLLIVVFAIPVLVEMPYLLKIWLSNVPAYTVVFCRYEIIQQLIASISITLVTSISATGDIKEFQIYSALAYLFRLPIIFILLKMGYNPISVYYVIILSVFVLCTGRIYYASVKCGLNAHVFLTATLFPSLALTLFMFISVLPITLFMTESLFRLICVIMMSTTILFIGLRYFVLTTYEKQLLSRTSIVIKKEIYEKLFARV